MQQTAWTLLLLLLAAALLVFVQTSHPFLQLPNLQRGYSVFATPGPGQAFPTLREFIKANGARLCHPVCATRGGHTTFTRILSDDCCTCNHTTEDVAVTLAVHSSHRTRGAPTTAAMPRPMHQYNGIIKHSLTRCLPSPLSVRRQPHPRNSEMPRSQQRSTTSMMMRAALVVTLEAQQVPKHRQRRCYQVVAVVVQPQPQPWPVPARACISTPSARR